MEHNPPLKPEKEAAKPKTEPGEKSHPCFLLIISEMNLKLIYNDIDVAIWILF